MRLMKGIEERVEGGDMLNSLDVGSLFLSIKTMGGGDEVLKALDK